MESQNRQAIIMQFRKRHSINTELTECLEYALCHDREKKVVRHELHYTPLFEISEELSLRKRFISKIAFYNAEKLLERLITEKGEKIDEYLEDIPLMQERSWIMPCTNAVGSHIEIYIQVCSEIQTKIDAMLRF